MKRRGGIFIILKFSKAMAITAQPTEQNSIPIPDTTLWDGAIDTLAKVANITSASIETVQRLFVDAITSESAEIRGRGISMMQIALGKAAERIVVLESMIESERNFREADRDFATKNETYL
jgi:hypothetical protein